MCIYRNTAKEDILNRLKDVIKYVVKELYQPEKFGLTCKSTE